MKKLNKKQLILLCCVFILILLIGISYAWYIINVVGTNQNVLKAATLSLELDESATNGINLEYAVPVTDEDGMSTTGYTFDLINNGTITSGYTIYLDDVELEEGEERLPDDFIKYSLTKNGETSTPVLLTDTGKNPNRVLETGEISSKNKNSYTLKLWIDSNADNSIMEKVFSARLRIEATQVGITDTTKEINVDLNSSEIPKIDLGGQDISNFSFISSDESIVTIDSEGNIIAMGPGEAVITIVNNTDKSFEKVLIKNTKTINVNYVSNENVVSISKTSDSCVLDTKGQTSCEVTLPEIVPVERYKVVGWNTDSTATTGDAVSNKVSVSQDTTYYTILSKISYSYTASFEKNGVGVDTITSSSLSCETGDADYCEVTLPEITVKDDYEVVGWSTNKDATDIDGVSVIYLPSTKVKLESDVTYYAISKKKPITYSVKFYLNGAGQQDGNTEEYVEKTCTIGAVYNNNEQATKCSITTPDITGSVNTPIVVGYATDSNATRADVEENTAIEVSSNGLYYAITKKDAVTYSVSYMKNGLGVQSLSKESDSCTIKAVFNGALQDSTCSVVIPTITVKDGYTALGFSENAEEDNENNVILENTEQLIDSDKTYYVISKKNAIELTATFYLNGAGSQTDSNNNKSTSETVTRSCTIDATYNDDEQATTCTITTPVVEGSVNTPTVSSPAYAIGDSSENENTTLGTVEQNTQIAISGGEKYSAITTNAKKEYTVTFSLNGAEKQTDEDGNSVNSDVERTCVILQTYNGVKQDSTCSVVSPTITGSTNTPVVIGYSTSSDNHDNEWSQNTSKDISSDLNYYAQTKKEDVTYTVSQFEAGTGVTISSISAKSCTIDATYNGVKQSDSCTITSSNLPVITPNVGYTTVGFSTTKGATTGVSEITLTSNVDKYYANAVANSYTIEYYDGSTKKGSTSAKVDAVPFNLTSASTLQIEKEGYTFKGWSTTNGGSVVYTDGQSINTNLSTNVGDVVKLYAVWVDDIAPVCSFSGNPTITTQNTANLTLTCTDDGSGLTAQTLTSADFTTASNGSVDVVVLDTTNSTSNKLIYTVTVRGLSVGTFTTSLSEGVIVDVGGNGNASAVSSKVTVNGRTYTATFTINGLGITGISSTTDSCTTTGSNLTCNVAKPTISVESGYTAIGWNTDPTATVELDELKSNSEITLSSDSTFYTISKKDAVTLKATFNKNGATLACSDSDSSTCTVNDDTIVTTCTIAEAYNNNVQDTTCSVVTPTITRDDFEIIGFNTNKDAEVSTMSVATKVSLTADSNNTDAYLTGSTYYAITRKIVTINWTANDHTIGSTLTSCTIKGTATTCTITTPTIEKDGVVILGWYDSNNNKFADANVDVSVSESATYIATSRSITASEIQYDNSNTGFDCTDAQCAIDELNNELEG